MADAAPAGDRGGFRGGFGDRGRQVDLTLLSSKPYFYPFNIFLFIVMDNFFTFLVLFGGFLPNLGFGT